MRASLSDPALTRIAGRFVWLELDVDKAGNQAFLHRHHVGYTPSLYVLDPGDERATAMHLGGLTVAELNRFLDEGERGFRMSATPPAGVALTRGDEWLDRGSFTRASGAYREAVRLAPAGSGERTRAVGSLAWSLWVGGEIQACADTAALEAPRMPRDPMFARVVLAGIASSLQGGRAPWARRALNTLEPLAEEAVRIPAVLRDHRYQLYQQLMRAAQARGDTTSVLRWSRRWLDEIDAVTPKDDDERSALDIARVDAVVDTKDLPRVIPALIASERAMPRNYNASLRLAQVEIEANHFKDAAAACDRGLAHVTGPLGRSWLERTKATALRDLGDKPGARHWLGLALESARAIGNPMMRDSNVRQITQELTALEKRSS